MGAWTSRPFDSQQRENQQAVLGDWVDNEPVLNAIAFSLAYVLMTTFSVPGAALMTLLAGALFGWVVG